MLLFLKILPLAVTEIKQVLEATKHQAAHVAGVFETALLAVVGQVHGEDTEQEGEDSETEEEKADLPNEGSGQPYKSGDVSMAIDTIAINQFTGESIRGVVGF